LGTCGSHHVSAGDPPTLSGVRRQVLPNPTRALSPPRRVRGLGQSVPDDVARLRVEHHPDVSPPGRRRLHLSWPAAGPLVLDLSDRACRGGSRVYGPYLAIDLRAIPAHAERG